MSMMAVCGVVLAVMVVLLVREVFGVAWPAMRVLPVPRPGVCLCYHLEKLVWARWKGVN